MSFIKRVMAKREISREHRQVEPKPQLSDSAVRGDTWDAAEAEAQREAEEQVAEDVWQESGGEEDWQPEYGARGESWQEADGEQDLQPEYGAQGESWQEADGEEDLESEFRTRGESWQEADGEEDLQPEYGARQESWQEADGEEDLDAAGRDDVWEESRVEEVIEIESAAPDGAWQTAARHLPHDVVRSGEKPGSGLYPADAVERHAASSWADSAPRDTAGSIELDTAKLRSTGLIVPRDMEPVFLEEFRRIKRPLLRNAFSRDASAPANSNVVVVTSALANEGKTFTSFNLAMSISAEREKTVLLIDADLQRGELSALLGLRHRKGLADRLNGTDHDLSELLVKTNVPKLTILPAGTPSSQSAELLSSETMASLTDELAERYPNRLVIIDSSPLLASSLAETISPLVGQIVLVVAAEQTPRKAVEQALANLHDCDLVGLVLNKRIDRPGLTYRENYYGSY